MVNNTTNIEQNRQSPTQLVEHLKKNDHDIYAL